VKTIDGVPEKITRAQLLSAVDILGLEAKRVRSIRIGVHFLEVTLYATQPVRLLWDHPTQHSIDGTTDQPATHTLFYDLDEPE